MTALPDPATSIEVEPSLVASLAAEIGAGQVLLIDCREQDEWHVCHLPGATLVPLSEFTTAASGLPARGLPCIVYCHHGMRSLKATHFLRANGLDRCWSMSGGIDRWSAEIDPAVPRY